MEGFALRSTEMVRWYSMTSALTSSAGSLHSGDVSMACSFPTTCSEPLICSSRMACVRSVGLTPGRPLSRRCHPVRASARIRR